MNAITNRAELEAYTGNQRLLDTVLAERLGFADPKHIRKLIERHREELQKHGELCAMVIEKQQGGRPGKVYWLNEAQALLICSLSRVAKAALTYQAVSDAYAEHRRSQVLGNAEPLMSPADPAPMDAAGLKASLALSSGKGRAAIYDRHLIDLTDHAARPGERFLVVCAQGRQQGKMMITEAEAMTLPGQWGGYSAWVRVTAHDKRHAIVLGRVVGRA